ncbi:MAG: hypothetical protein JJU09_08720 [Rhodobacteraceae bacterium]|nr:hypothetical protein [Paracoccaceae bacterium]
MIRAIPLTCALVVLAACMQEEAAAPSCPADALQHHVGQPVDQIDRDSLPQGHRIIGPGMAVTMDFREDRLNIEYDDEEIVTRVYCG